MFKYHKGIFFVLFFLAVQNCFAQTPTIKTFIDKDNILIGQHISYKVVLTLPNQSFAVNWFTVPDSLLHFELVEQSKLDSSVKDDNLIMEQTLTLTSFDSGVFKTPSFKIDIVNNGNSKSFFTDSIPISIGYAVPDSTNQLRDIKPIIEVADSSALWIIITVIILAVLVFATLVYFAIKHGSKKTILVKRTSLAAYDEAMQRLQKLKDFNYKDETTTKKYYIELSSLLKYYISRKQQQNLLSSTTSDLLLYCKSKNIMDDSFANLANTLRMSDAVKFAKYLPIENENDDNWQTIKNIINLLENKQN